uniref:Uncharacterized protein n=1 Tax=Eutreptiella gymnastica TaxID=73025 RepID=A0A7S1HWW4_9EUGL
MYSKWSHFIFRPEVFACSNIFELIILSNADMLQTKVVAFPHVWDTSPLAVSNGIRDEIVTAAWAQAKHPSNEKAGRLEKTLKRMKLKFFFPPEEAALCPLYNEVLWAYREAAK